MSESDLLNFLRGTSAIVLGSVTLYVVVAIYRCRQGLAHGLDTLVRGGVGFAVAWILVTMLGAARDQADVAAFCVGCFAILTMRDRPRRIPSHVRRRVIERDLKGEKFDGSKYHVDHVYPFSRGGSSTEDNLRVIEKKANLKKGAKRPRLREML